MPQKLIAFLIAIFAWAATPSLAQQYQTQVFQLPEGSRPHDAAPAPDGKIWYTAQRQGALGIIDPATGEMQVFRDPDGRGPYGIAASPDGEIYYVSLAGSHLGRVNRETGAVTMIEPTVDGAGPRAASGRRATVICGCPNGIAAG